MNREKIAMIDTKEVIGIPLNHTQTINNIQDFLIIIDNLKSSYDCGFKGEDLWYRGISDMEKHSLLPSILRGSILDNNDYKYENELSVYQSFIRESRSYINLTNDHFLLLCYAQHFNVPTRLLDFTVNPLVALYFACKELKSKDGAVWMINTKEYNKQVNDVFNKKKLVNSSIEEMKQGILDKVFSKESKVAVLYPFPIAVIPHYIDQRMMAQGSRFLLWGDTPVCLERMFVYGDYIDTHYDNTNSFVKRIRIPAKRKANLLNQLDMLGVNEKMLFPGLDGIGKYIKQHYLIDKYNKSDLKVKESEKIIL